MSEYIITCDEETASWIGNDVDSMRPLVRCRDCAYNAKDTDGICYRFDHEHFNQPDGFCAWGERKEGGE